MNNRFFDEYEEFAFNNLYNFIIKLSNSKNDWINTRAKKIKEKLDTYYSVVTEDEGKVISIGWFGEELRDLLYMYLISFSIKTDDDNNYFLEAIQRKEEQEYDPDFLMKCKIKHFSDNAMFLSNEKEKLYKKGYNIIKCLNENTNHLELGFTDFPCRYWTILRQLKTKQTEYEINQISEGWKINKTEILKKEKTQQTTTFILNNQTLEFEILQNTTKQLSEEEISAIWS